MDGDRNSAGEAGFEEEDGIGGPETAREGEWYRERIVFEM